MAIAMQNSDPGHAEADDQPNSHLPPRLLQLPAEIRLMIWRHALVKNSDVRVQLRALQPPALLATCRQILHEATSIFFSENRFVLTVAIPPAIHLPNRTRVHRVPIPAWVQALERSTRLHMRDVKVEIDYAFRWVVIAMAQSRGPLSIVEAWVHNGRQKLPIVQMCEKVKAFLDYTLEQKTDVEEEAAGLNYRDVVLIAGKMCHQWAGSIVPA